MRKLLELKSEEFGQTIIASARAEGWNACLNTIMGNLDHESFQEEPEYEGKDKRL